MDKKSSVTKAVSQLGVWRQSPPASEQIFRKNCYLNDVTLIKKNVLVVFEVLRKTKKTFSLFSEITYRYQNLTKILQNDYINDDQCDFA